MAVTITISGKDQTGAAVKSVARAMGTSIPRAAAAGMASVAKAASAAARAVARSFAGAASSAIRSLTSIKGAIITLAGAVGFGALIRGAADANLTLKAFAGLLRVTEDEAKGVGRELVDASLGMVSFKNAMQLGNRALASGTLSIRQLKTAMTFISKTAIASGLNVQDSFNKVITGLVRGSTLLLDDFGILVGGVDEVKERFDSLRGAGAFNALGEGAKKAEIIGEAVRQMGERLSRLSAVVKGDLAIQIRQMAANMRNIAVSAGRFLLTTKLGSFLRQAITFTNRLASVISLLKPGELGAFFKDLFKAIKPVLEDIKRSLFDIVKGMGRIILATFRVAGAQIVNDILRGLQGLPGVPKPVTTKLGGFGGGQVVPLEVERLRVLDEEIANLARSFTLVRRGVFRELPKAAEKVLRPTEERFGLRADEARRERQARVFPQIGEALASAGGRLAKSLRAGGAGLKDVFTPVKETVTRLVAETAKLRPSTLAAQEAVKALKERGTGLTAFRRFGAGPAGLSREQRVRLQDEARAVRRQARFLENLIGRGAGAERLRGETSSAEALLAGTGAISGEILPRLQAALIRGAIDQKEFTKLAGLLTAGFKSQTAAAAAIADGLGTTTTAAGRIEDALSGLNAALVGG